MWSLLFSKYVAFSNRYSSLSGLALFLVGFTILTIGLSDISSAQSFLESISDSNRDEGFILSALGSLLRLLEGTLGSLIMVIGGLGAIIAAGMGAYKAALNMLIVAIGAFLLRSVISLFSDSSFPAIKGSYSPGK